MERSGKGKRERGVDKGVASVKGREREEKDLICTHYFVSEII